MPSETPKTSTVSTISLRSFVEARLLTQKRKLSPRFSRIPEKHFGSSYVYCSKGGVYGTKFDLNTGA
jgi:hypothetical protein